MKNVLYTIRAAALAICATSFALTNATAVQITSTEVIYNFDFSSMAPSPPYTNITFGATYSATDPVTVNVDTVLTRLYGGLGGTQLLQVRNDSAPGFSYNVSYTNGGTTYGPLTTANAIFDPMLDGKFSIGLQATAGSAELVSVFTCGLNNGAPGPCITLAVPEPSAAILFPIGLIAIAALAGLRKRAALSIQS